MRMFVLPAMLVLTAIAGCHSSPKQSSDSKRKMSAAAPTAAAAPKPARPTIRIKAGSTDPFTDSAGNIWLADQGFADGDTTTRDADLPIANTNDPAMFRSEHYDMTQFSIAVPNGKYDVKLYFAETYEDISGTGQRVFTFNVQGHEFKDFDVWEKAGGKQKAYIQDVDVEITDGKLNITFTPNVQSPEINAIEIIPE